MVPAAPSATEPLPTLSIWRGEFTDTALEQSFRASVQHTMARHLRMALALWAALMLLFALPDLQVLGSHSRAMLILVAYRLAMIALLLLAMGQLLRRPHLAPQGWLVSSVAMVGYPFYFLMLELRPDIRQATVSMVMFLQFTVFIFLPGRVLAYLPVALLGAVGTVATYVLQGREPTVVVGVAFLVIAPAVVGYITAARLQLVQRQEYALRQRLAQANTALQDEIARRTELEAELQRQATTDPLTGLANRRELGRRFAVELARAQREAAPLSVVLIDLDHFKQVNDTYGHAAGDAVLRTLAQLATDAFRTVDTVARLGGEEFAALLPGADLHSTAQAARRLAERLASTPVEHDGQRISARMTVGVAQCLPTETTLEAMLERADTALYSGKQAGRSRIMLALPDGAHWEFAHITVQAL